MDYESIIAEMKRWLRVQLNDLADTAAAGPVPDWESYQRLRGRIEGFALSEAMLIELIDKQQKDMTK